MCVEKDLPDWTRVVVFTVKYPLETNPTTTSEHDVFWPLLNIN